jgi:hypothetical protein
MDAGSPLDVTKIFLPPKSARKDLQAENPARLAFDRDLKGTATDLAVGGEALARLARVNRQVE